MVYGVFGDIHGNVKALQRVLCRLQKEDTTDRLCLGDVVEAGTHRDDRGNEACMEAVLGLLKEGRGGVWVQGNHEGELYYLPGANPALHRRLLVWRSPDGMVVASRTLFSVPQALKLCARWLETWYTTELESICMRRSDAELLQQFERLVVEEITDPITRANMRELLHRKRAGKEYKELLTKRAGPTLVLLGHRHAPLLLQCEHRTRHDDPVAATTLLDGDFKRKRSFKLRGDCSYLAIPGPVFNGYGLVYRRPKEGEAGELLFFRQCS